MNNGKIIHKYPEIEVLKLLNKTDKLYISLYKFLTAYKEVNHGPSLSQLAAGGFTQSDNFLNRQET